jgi:chemotaxis signal transduction protein
MEERQLLVFRCGDKEYGIPVEDVCEVVGNAWLNGFPLLGIPENNRKIWNKPLSVLKFPSDSRKKTNSQIIVIQSNGFQMALLVDEVIRVMKYPSGVDPAGDTTVASFKIWRLSDRARAGNVATIQ